MTVWGNSFKVFILIPGAFLLMITASMGMGAIGIGNTAFKAALQSNKEIAGDVTDFYAKMKFQPVWFVQGQLSQCGQVAADVLKNASLEGLNSHDYEDATHALTTPSAHWMDVEILLTKRFLEFIAHVRVGRIDPALISHNIKFHKHDTHAVDLLVNALQNQSDCHKLRQMAPAIPQYAQLKNILANYRNIAKETKDWPKIEKERKDWLKVKPSNSLKLGDSDPGIPNLRKILILLGDLKKDDGFSPKFDKALEGALRQFQMRNTIEPDGVVGGKTREALKVSIHGLIRKVLVNMERLRWLPEDLGDRHLIVNVAGYEVRAYEKNALQLIIPAIIGRPSRHTPLFYATLKNVVLNPSWGVPHSILVDKIPKIINDPDYIRRLGFTVTDSNGNIIDPDHADWENEGAHYHLRQSPGSHNALGRIKFNIENPYTIYLHGTPDEKLFKRPARAFSSGCIRLKDPVELASWILDNNDQWNKEGIEEAIHKGNTQTVQPDGSLPVFFTYQTVWMGKDRLVHISDDPYKMDAKMEKVLDMEEVEEEEGKV
jgi:murein L,D-transpeptidase YcbB/YkuD